VEVYSYQNSMFFYAYSGKKARNYILGRLQLIERELDQRVRYSIYDFLLLGDIRTFKRVFYLNKEFQEEFTVNYDNIPTYFKIFL
jgi:hypothetical protein